MTKAQFERERLYQLTMATFKTLLVRGTITAAEYGIIDTKMRAKYSPLLGSLYPQNDLIIQENDGNMCNTEDVSEGD
jgi:hypothetical protein